MSTWHDLGFCILFIVAAMVVIFGPILVGAALVSGASCSDISKRTEVRTEWSLWTGCYVESNGKLIPKDRWIRIEGEVGQ